MEELKESELGTQEYWDNRYKKEIENFENHGDHGEVWFGEDTVERIVKWINCHPLVAKNFRILDVGCGNGMFLVQLFDKGYKNLVGIDYSEDAIVLAKSIVEKRNIKIEYFVCNILESLEGQFDLIHDKGTYDAISLHASIKEYRMRYLENVKRALKRSGFFVITSCNWTRDELNEHFKDHFVCVDTIPAPQFKFGGKTGSTVTTLIYAHES